MAQIAGKRSKETSPRRLPFFCKIMLLQPKGEASRHMVLTRFAIGLLTTSALLCSTALAVPPIGGGVGAGVGGGIHVGAPPVSVPSINHPPVNVPQVNAPQPHASAIPAASANASVRANANSSVSAGLPMHGTVTAINGSTVSVKLANGTVQTYTISSATAAALQSSLHKSITFTARNGVLALSNRETNPPLQGTLTSLNGTTATVKLAGGATRTFSVTSDESAWLKAHVGKHIAFWSNANGTLRIDNGAQH